MVDDITHAEVTEEKIIDCRYYHTIKEVKNGEGPHPIKTPKDGYIWHTVYVVVQLACAMCFTCI